MTEPIPINLAVEDELSEVFLRTLLRQIAQEYCVGACYRRGGFGYLRKTIDGFNNAAKGTPFLVLTDLDACQCAPALIREWLPGKEMQPNLLFRVAVHEIESWVLADRKAFAEFAGIRTDLIPDNVDSLSDPKQFLIGLVRKCRKRDLKNDIVPAKNSTARQGPDYNGRLAQFVLNFWRHREALPHSESLSRAAGKLLSFRPSWVRQ
jgi:hypothetical protein